MEKKKVLILLSCLVFLFAKAPQAQTGEDVKIFLKKLEGAIGNMNTYRCVMTSENWKGRKHEYKVSRLQFKKPNLMRLDVLKGKKKGSTVVLNKEGKIRGKNSWGLRKTLKPTDKRLKNIRGYTFLNSSLLDKVERIKRHILEKGFEAALEETEWEGRPAYHLHIDYSDPDSPVTDEDIWFNKETYATLKNLKYEGETKVTDVTWQDFEINIPLDDKLFVQ
ncbi:hypothetical protein OAA99_01395 [Omnitrophica bacterium]|nr:hypothetical protein [Candidatus Omnitrophota bacterium]